MQTMTIKDLARENGNNGLTRLHSQYQFEIFKVAAERNDYCHCKGQF